MPSDARVIELAQKRNRPGKIAVLLGCRPETVYQIIRRARKNGVDIPIFSTSKGKTPLPGAAPVPQHIPVNVRLYSLLVKEAGKQKLTVHETAERLLEDALLGTVVGNG